MCKLIVLAGITKETRKAAWDFIGTITPIMSAGDRDGFGYAAIAGDGSLYGERWLNNADAWTHRDRLSKFDQDIVDKYDGMLSKDEVYNSFGSLQFDAMTSITLHARMATSGKSFINTHPFVDGHTSVIHNGVLAVHNRGELKQSSCDSEQILTKYLKHKVNFTPANIQKVANELDGYYACGMFSQDKQGTVILDVFKDSRAVLSGVFVKELNTVVFATALSHVYQACKQLNFTIESNYDVMEGNLLRLDAITGDVMQVIPFDDTYKGKKSKSSSFGATRGTHSGYPKSQYEEYDYYGAKVGDHEYKKVGNEWVKHEGYKPVTELVAYNKKG